MAEVLALEGLDGPALAVLADEFPFERARHLDDARRLSDVRALIVRNQTRVDRDALDRLPRLEVVARAGVGLDNIDIPAMSAAGVVVTHTPGANAASTAEHTLALALAAAHRIAELDRDVREGHWNRRLGHELAGTTWGVVGYGRIGRRVAALASGIGMRVVASDPAVEAADDDVKLVALDDLLHDARVVSLHVPLTDGSRHLIGAAELARMRPEAILVNSARGGIVDETALATALRTDAIGGAALDVREQEPPHQPDPLAELEAVVLTPHVAALTVEAQADVLRQVSRDVRAVLQGREAEQPANFPRPRRLPVVSAATDRDDGSASHAG